MKSQEAERVAPTLCGLGPGTMVVAFTETGIKEETQVWRIDACRNTHTITSVDVPVRRVSVENRRDVRARGTEGAASQLKASGETPRQKGA